MRLNDSSISATPIFSWRPNTSLEKYVKLIPFVTKINKQVQKKYFWLWNIIAVKTIHRTPNIVFRRISVLCALDQLHSRRKRINRECSAAWKHSALTATSNPTSQGICLIIGLFCVCFPCCPHVRVMQRPVLCSVYFPRCQETPSYQVCI